MEDRGAANHSIRRLRPAPGLESFVRCYAQRDARIRDAEVVHPIHARAAALLEFIFGDRINVTYCNGRPAKQSPTSVLVGMQTGRRGLLHIRGTVDCFVIMFQPSALYRLFSLPMSELTDADFEALAVLGPAIAGLEQRLGDYRSFEERASVANQFLLRRALATAAMDGVEVAANQILRGAGGARIPAMADRAGLGLRQFQRRFVERVGMSPKLFARIARFEATLDLMARSPARTWTDVAHRFGYYDHMHMVHEFAEFTGETPTSTLLNLHSVFREEIAEMRSTGRFGETRLDTRPDARLIL
jgi:AraC-like DNA-binding protein